MTAYNGFQDLSKRKRHNVKRRKSELQQHANQGSTEQKTCVRDMTTYNGFQDLCKRKRHNIKKRKSELQQHANQGAAEQKTCGRDMTAWTMVADSAAVQQKYRPKMMHHL
ncbi:hypothetical protein SESBI_47041 [Sesbania bispinosa]|nr:hypothetical protein SESBI_47041 [Sesbania bispinosa]